MKHAKSSKELTGPTQKSEKKSKQDWLEKFDLPEIIPLDRTISRCLPEFVPISKDPSDIIDREMRAQIAKYLPPLVKMREWKLLFTIGKDGVSYTTFYENVRDRDNTVLLVKDSKGKVFGAYCSEAWKKTMHFYGLGESFIFTFDDHKKI